MGGRESTRFPVQRRLNLPRPPALNLTLTLTLTDGRLSIEVALISF